MSVNIHTSEGMVQVAGNVNPQRVSYLEINNKPKINGKILSGDISLDDLGAATKDDVQTISGNLNVKVASFDSATGSLYLESV